MGDLERIRAIYETAMDDPDTLVAVLDDDVSWEWEGAGIPGLANCRGPAAVLEFFRGWAAPFEFWNYEALEVFQDGDRIIGHVRQWGQGRASGVRAEHDFWQIWHMRDGKAVRVTHQNERPV